MGPESCRVDLAGSASLGRRAAGPANQHEAAPKERKDAHRTGFRNAPRGGWLVWKEEDSPCGGWILRIAGRLEYNKHDDHLAYALRRFALQIAAETQTTRPGQTSKTRCRISQTQVAGCVCSQVDAGDFYRSRPVGHKASVFAKGSLVQSQQDAGAACDLAGSERQGAGRLFFYDRCGDESRRRFGCLRRPVGHRGYFQKHQTVSWRRAVADVGKERPRASGGSWTLAVLDGLAVVLPTTRRQTNVQNSAVVHQQNHTQLHRCTASLAKSSVARMIYYDVREFHCT